MAAEVGNTYHLQYFASTSGGALSAPGGDRLAAASMGEVYNSGAAGNASGGGGGHGGIGPFAQWTGSSYGGIGGANGAAGSAGAGFGCGGGGGSGNAAGGNGSPGVLWIAWLEDADSAGVTALLARLAAQVLTGPVAVIPAPGASTQTAVWIRCYGPDGLPAAGVVLTITCIEASDPGAFDSDPVTLTSDGAGVAQGYIPRGAGLGFLLQRGSGLLTRFSGVDADTLELPPIIGP